MKLINCPACGTEVEWPAKFCPQCGKSLKMFRNMVECRACGNLVAKDANKCPHCGTRNPNKTLLAAKIALSVILFLFVFTVIMALGTGEDSDATDAMKAAQAGQSNTASPSASQTTETEEETIPEYIEISATELWEAYQENEINADLKYGDKLLAVSGVVSGIGKDIVTDAPCISLDSGSAYGMYPIQCFFPKYGEQTELLARLKEGDSVTIYGKCTGEFVMTVQLSKCAIAP